jgi:hypothetical protein
MNRIKLYEEFLNEANNMRTLRGFLKELKKEYGPVPTEQSLADFIYNNYEEVTGEKLEDSDPAANDHIADIIAHFRMDGEDFMIAWEDRVNESVQEAATTPKDSKVTVDDYLTDKGVEIKSTEIVGAMVSCESEKDFEDYFYDQYGMTAFTENDINTLKTYFNEYLEEITAKETEEEEKEKEEEEQASGDIDSEIADLEADL